MSRILFLLLLSAAAPLAAHAAGPYKSSCREIARSCKERCSASFGIGGARHDCKKGCVAHEHACRAGCY